MAYFLDDDYFDFEHVKNICGEVPCLFLTYNNKKIHVYFHIPKVYITNDFSFKIIKLSIIVIHHRKPQWMRNG
jgi:hypothetical protein